jgi:acetylornithine deacetylase/succinyl-diaminopimelate desuccinylase-like protein
MLSLFPNPQYARAFAALLANTVSPTALRAGAKTNAIPSRAEAEFDGRIAPGQTKDDLLRELRAVVGDDVEIDLIRHDAAGGHPARHRP